MGCRFELGGLLPPFNAEAVVNEEPNLTPVVCAYLMSQTQSNATQVSAIVDAMIDADDFLSPWQSLWLVEVMKGYRPLSETQERWARGLALGRPVGVVSAAAAVLLAENKQISIEELGQLYREMSAASRPTIGLALSIADPNAASPITKATAAESPMNRAVMTDPDDIPF